METAEGGDLTDRSVSSTSSEQLARFLPKSLKGVPILIHEGGLVYRVENRWLKSKKVGLAYRLSRHMEDRDLNRKGDGPRWGARVLGLNECNGWVAVEIPTRTMYSRCDASLSLSSSTDSEEQWDSNFTNGKHRSAAHSQVEDDRFDKDLLHDDDEQRDTSELECAICLDVLCQPLRLLCSHVFCRDCTVHSAAERRTCPMCRADMPDSFDPRSALVDIDLQEQIIRSAGGVLQSREAGITCEQYLHYGNRLELIPSLKGNFDKQGRRIKQRRWTLFVELEGAAESLIQSVCFQLPPHSGSDVWVVMPPFKISRLDQGQGEVPVQIVVIWQPDVKQPSLILEHKVSFGEGVASKSLSVDVPKGLKDRHRG